MIAATIAGVPWVDVPVEAGKPATLLESLRSLLLRGAQALYQDDASQLQTECDKLTTFVENLRPVFGKLFPDCDDLAPVQMDQQRRRVLRSVLEARALYLAAMRRCQRSVRLRRSLFDIRLESSADNADELSRWC